jgi:hypothetical protein
MKDTITDIARRSDIHTVLAGKLLTRRKLGSAISEWRIGL